LTKSGVIVNPHFGQVLSSDARTLSRLIFRDRGTGGSIKHQGEDKANALFVGRSPCFRWYGC